MTPIDWPQIILGSLGGGVLVFACWVGLFKRPRGLE